MDMTYWQKQPSDKPLFPDLLWSRPENRQFAGKLLIIGGNLYGFATAGEAYQAAQQAGVGVARVLLPDALHKLVGRTLETGEFAASTPSGSFSQKALTEFLPHAAWSDGVLFAGDLGRNSETAILIEKFVSAYHGQLVLTKDAVDYVTASPEIVVNRQETTLVLSFAQLQKLAGEAKFLTPFIFSMDMLRLVEALHAFTLQHSVSIITKHLDTLFAASNGDVSTTKLPHDRDIWRVRMAAYASVWLIQNPSYPFQALTTAIHDMVNR
jgi:NAD(P)H-hydrate repair Nnr-like enzyme with NAD(P)H-hydrate dehydratase domain